MPPRRNAEAGTVDEQSPAVVGNVDAHSDLEELVLRQDEMIQKLAAQVDVLSALEQKRNEDSLPAQLKTYEPPVLREGYKRYGCRYTEHTMMRVGEGHEMHGGRAVPVPIIIGKPIDFNGGVFETNDPEEIEFIENHPDYVTGVVWDDPTAVRRHSAVEVTDGLKGTTTTPRVPLSAPMAP